MVIIVARIITVRLARTFALMTSPGKYPEMLINSDNINAMESIIALLAKMFLIRMKVRYRVVMYSSNVFFTRNSEYFVNVFLS